ncbi:hypothetical protein CW735_15615 [Alteromonas sp. MB-3u-76]|uniref:hypothetical protein n=1 Tax=Alteromonas sp. MB-3u-76 TaxID=2058133 RepID=UPI000C312AEC|nr:hypothetical protein [Alteromonas sp. MB-3u-76]AUC89440.1 hypothetical protein CW735_15615 [Alteromonas sp. MB-3u-76]
MNYLSQVLIISYRKNLKVNKNEGVMKYLVVFLIIGSTFAEAKRDGADCDPVKADEVIDSFTVNNIKEINSIDVVNQN